MQADRMTKRHKRDGITHHLASPKTEPPYESLGVVRYVTRQRRREVYMAMMQSLIRRIGNGT